MRQPEAPPMTVDEFLAWAEAQPGDTRYELIEGQVVAMSPERNIHAHVKAEVWAALRSCIRERELPCVAHPDGVTVVIDEHTVYEPDAAVTCGDEAKVEETTVPSPFIVVEILSPGTERADANQKLKAYFQLPSVRHYLVFDPIKTIVAHYRRVEGTSISLEIVTGGTIDLSPPGITIDIDQIYRDAWKGLAE